FLLTISLSSCKDPQITGGSVNNDVGLLNFTVSIPEAPEEYSAIKAGPYEEGDTLNIEVPTTKKNQLDLNGLEAFASIANNANIVEPTLGGIQNFTKPLEIIVQDGIGNTQTNYVKILPTLPKTVFEKMWFKDAQTLGIERTNISGMTVSGNNLL